MATRITVVANHDGQFRGWMCKHSSHAVQRPDCDSHVTLCERCAAAVRNGADLLADDDGHKVAPVKIAVVGIARSAAAGC